MAILTEAQEYSYQDCLENNPSGRGRSRRCRYRRNRRRQSNEARAQAYPNFESEESLLSSGSNTTELIRSKEEQAQYVALDCEMVGVGWNGKQSALARVSLVDWDGNILMDECVKQTEEVTDYRTFVSGITPQMLWGARLDFKSCQKYVMEIIHGKILVGHGLKNDLRALDISHPWHMVRDTAKYEPFMKVRFHDGVLWPRGLRELCKEKLNRDVQMHGRPHCPTEDAWAALDLYKSVQHKWEKTMEYKINKTRLINEQRRCINLNVAARE